MKRALVDLRAAFAALRARAKPGLAVAIVLLSTAAAADDKVLVLKAEGRADKKVRAKVEKAVLDLAAASGVQPTAGDITFGDAAAMVGCKPDEDTCKVQVLEMLAVDELVAIATTPKPGGIEVSVRRIGKGGTTKSAAALVSSDAPERLEPIASLFGRTAPPPAPPPPANPTVAPAPSVHDPRELTPPTDDPPPAEPPQVADLGPPPDRLPIAPRDEEPRPSGSRRLAMFGMAGGGALLITGIVFWASAKGVEAEIEDAPNRTRADLEKLRDLESRGDAYATAGNVLAVSGLVLGGVSTYFFLKRGRRSSTTARITPALVPGGGGITITWGGSP